MERDATTTTRIRNADLTIFKEIARQVGCRDRDAITYAAMLQARALDIDLTLLADVTATALGSFVVTLDVDPPAIHAEVTEAGQPTSLWSAEPIYALNPWPVEVLSPVKVLLRHRGTGYRFDMGEVPRAEVRTGAQLSIDAAELSDRWIPPMLLSTETLDQVRLNLQLRQASRASS